MKLFLKLFVVTIINVSKFKFECNLIMEADVALLTWCIEDDDLCFRYIHTRTFILGNEA